MSQRPVNGSIRTRVGPPCGGLNLQTFSPSPEVDRLVDDYLDGATVNELADRYGVHRAAVSTHLTRRPVGRRRPGLGVDETAETVP